MAAVHSSNTGRLIGITAGDAAGIGPEVAWAALASGKLDRDFQYVLVGDEIEATPGQPTRATALASWNALEEAARRALSGELAAVVTGPVCKSSLYQVGFQYPGQTEFFAARCGTENFAMTLTGRGLTVSLVSTHLPLLDAIRQLTVGEIVRVGTLMAVFLRQRLRAPVRIAVAGLNPHAGERGTLGREEIDIIAPAIARLSNEHSSTEVTFGGPVSPDAVFHQAVAGKWDGVLCLYHDQGLIPLKLHAFDEGVNVTVGLPIVRTSPDHGTAFELAGKNLAHAGSMIAAVRLATELVRIRQGRGDESCFDAMAG